MEGTPSWDKELAQKKLTFPLLLRQEALCSPTELTSQPRGLIRVAEVILPKFQELPHPFANTSTFKFRHLT